jgi:hypothetical protein
VRESPDLFAMVAGSIVSQGEWHGYIDILTTIIDIPGKCRQLLHDNHVHTIHQRVNRGRRDPVLSMTESGTL